MLTIGHVRRAVLAGLFGLAMVTTGGVAVAQDEGASPGSSESSTESSPSSESPAPELPQLPELPLEQVLVPQTEDTEDTTETPTDDPEPPARPLVSVLADCYDGFKSLGVWVEGADGVTYEVTLAPAEGGDGVTRTTEADDEGLQRVFFENPSPGDYVVTVVGDDGSEGGSQVTVEKCSTLEPDAPLLSVEVTCVDDYGTVVIRVANPGTGDTRTFSVDVEAIELWDGLRLSGGYFVDIVEQGFEDGTYEVVLREDGQEVASEEFTVKCAPVEPPVPTTPAPTTTTAPPAQGGATPGGGGLATTGAAVGGLAVLGVVVLALGAGLVLVGRRRRVTPE